MVCVYRYMLYLLECYSWISLISPFIVSVMRKLLVAPELSYVEGMLFVRMWKAQHSYVYWPCFYTQLGFYSTPLTPLILYSVFDSVCCQYPVLYSKVCEFYGWQGSYNIPEWILNKFQDLLIEIE